MTTIEPQDRWLGLSRAARLGRAHESTIHRAAAAGELPYALIGGRRFFLQSDVIAWREARRRRRTDVIAWREAKRRRRT